MHGDSPITDEQGTGDLPVAVALDQQGQHVRFTVGEVELGPGRRRTGVRARLAGQPGSLRQLIGQGEHRRRRKLGRQALTRRQGTCSLIRRPARTADSASRKRAYASRYG